MLSNEASRIISNLLITELGKGISQHDLAKSIGVNPANISRWISGTQNLRYTSAQRIAEYFKYPDWQSLVVAYHKSRQVTARQIVASMPRPTQVEVFQLLARTLVAG